jgi:hypothetical protein
MERLVQPEWLDHLAVDDPGAMGSRRDLKRLNFWMGNAAILARTIPATCDGWTPTTVIEIGAGDGDFLLSVARRCPHSWRRTHAVLIDRHSVVSSSTRRQFDLLGWSTETVQSDVFDWLEKDAASTDGLIIANLFLHHFEAASLARLLRLVGERARGFIAVEPRRSTWSFFFSRMVRWIGCNAVTEHDAPLSVKAGFAGDELTPLWPNHADWRLREREAGLFSHVFAAVKATRASSDGPS